MDKKRHILLLNPPGKKSYLRDYYCSHTSKARYYYYPYDLFVQSGILGENHYVDGMDANVLHWSSEKTLTDMELREFDAILFLTGAVSWKEDFEFIEKVIKEYPLSIAATGDILLTQGKEIMEKTPWLDAVLMDFTSESLGEFWQGKYKGEQVNNLIYRHNDEIIDGGRSLEKGEYSHPLPRYELFPYHKYRVPYGVYHPYAETLTDYGCPFHCTFCFSGELGYRTRNLDNWLREVQYYRSLNIKELRFKDLTFGCRRKHHMEVCDIMLSENLGMSWSCLSRVDVLNEEILEKMAASGCHTIQLGVENADSGILKTVKKGITREKTFEVFSLCRQYNIRTLAHFIIGLPGETRESAMETLELAKELDPYIASFNLAMPRIGSKLREEALTDGKITKEDDTFDNSKGKPVIEIDGLSKEELWKVKNEVIRKFYLRPGFFNHFLEGIRSPGELLNAVFEGLALFRS